MEQPVSSGTVCRSLSVLMRPENPERSMRSGSGDRRTGSAAPVMAIAEATLLRHGFARAERWREGGCWSRRACARRDCSQWNEGPRHRSCGAGPLAKLGSLGAQRQPGTDQIRTTTIDRRSDAQGGKRRGGGSSFSRSFLVPAHLNTIRLWWRSWVVAVRVTRRRSWKLGVPTLAGHRAVAQRNFGDTGAPNLR